MFIILIFLRRKKTRFWFIKPNILNKFQSKCLSLIKMWSMVKTIDTVIKQGWSWWENNEKQLTSSTSHFKIVHFYLFWRCPATFVKQFSVDNSWNQLNSWIKSSLWWKKKTKQFLWCTKLQGYMGECLRSGIDVKVCWL